MQNWKKLGRIFVPDGKSWWMHSHAMMPCVLQVDENVFRIFFSPRDAQNRSRPAFLEINMKKPIEYFNLTSTPLLEIGPLGAFDDNGIMPTFLARVKDKIYMFYNGWTLGKNVPFFSFNGIAVSEDNGVTFRKLSRGPIALYRNDVDPFSTFAPFVIKEGNIWKMWYVSCVGWQHEYNVAKHYYHIKFAESEDGINWQREGHVAIDFKNEKEYAIARPVVLKEDGKYKMWFSYRASNYAETYRIGYSESLDGTNWERKDDEVNIDVSKNGWDSEMICYGYIFDHQGDRYMLYNGNGYGKTGIGLAILSAGK